MFNQALVFKWYSLQSSEQICSFVDKFPHFFSLPFSAQIGSRPTLLALLWEILADLQSFLRPQSFSDFCSKSIFECGILKAPLVLGSEIISSMLIITNRTPLLCETLTLRPLIRNRGRVDFFFFQLMIWNSQVVLFRFNYFTESIGIAFSDRQLQNPRKDSSYQRLLAEQLLLFLNKNCTLQPLKLYQLYIKLPVSSICPRKSVARAAAGTRPPGELQGACSFIGRNFHCK